MDETKTPWWSAASWFESGTGWHVVQTWGYCPFCQGIIGVTQRFTPNGTDAPVTHEQDGLLPCPHCQQEVNVHVVISAPPVRVTQSGGIIDFGATVNITIQRPPAPAESKEQA